MIGSLGSVALTDPDAVLVDDTDAIITQVTTDVLVTEAFEAMNPPSLVPGPEVLSKKAALALKNPDSLIQPPAGWTPPRAESSAAGSDTAPSDDQVAATRRRFVDQVISEVTERRRRAGTLSFNDLLTRLRDALIDRDGGDSVRQVLRARYSVALIDEFQDTDPVQWAIFDELFGHDAGGTEASGTLMLVGDPKQAIYAFRGANVHTYLEAVENTEQSSLEVNWRSDPAVLDANQALLDGVSFGDERIAFESVRTSERNLGRRFTTGDGSPIEALSIRLAVGDGIPRNKHRNKGHLATALGSVNIYRDLARHVRDLLRTARVPDPEAPDGDDTGASSRRLEPCDVAVLITANREGPEVRDALVNLGIPAVISRGDSVLRSDAATQWHRLLYAMVRPENPTRAAAVPPLPGSSGETRPGLPSATDEDLAHVQETLQNWVTCLRDRGVAAFIGAASSDTSHIDADGRRRSVAARVLELRDGERHLTDLDHVAELLSTTATNAASASALLNAFEQLGQGHSSDPEVDIAARRVESESSAVQIMTTFVAKGLEFPVVCCPSLSSATPEKPPDNIWWDHSSAERNIDIASDLAWGSATAQQERRNRALREIVGTNLRVLYVALTRARHHTAVWWLPTEGAWRTGLARTLFARDAYGHIDAELFGADSVPALSDHDSLTALEPIIEASRGAIRSTVVCNRSDDLDTAVWSTSPDEEPPALEVSSLDRPLDRGRSRWSFTAITAAGGDRHFDPTDDPRAESGGGDDDPEGSGSAAGPGPSHDSDPRPREPLAESGGPQVPERLPLGAIVGGAGFGTLVHTVLERLDFCSEDLSGDLAELVDERLRWSPWPVDRDTLTAGLARVIRTPLGPLFCGRALAEVPQADRLNEVEFDLTLGERGARATDAAIGRVILEHLEDGSPHRRWAERLADGPFATILGGHLTGSIDLVARIHHPDGIDRFVVCDYKTNRIAPRDTEPTAEDFTPPRLASVMAEHDYQLQALLYSVALHRYLRWRIHDYDPAVHLGGVGYLFVRGMVGPSTPTEEGVPNGLADWRPPADLIADLSDLLDGTLAAGA